MHGSMNGYYEVRATGPGRDQYRLFCVLDNGTSEELEERGFQSPQIAVINGLMKPHRTVFSDGDYRQAVRAHGERYRSSSPRPVAS